MPRTRPSDDDIRDRASDAAAEMLLDLEREQFLLARDRKLDCERLVDRRDRVIRELNVNDRADDLDYFTGVHLIKVA